MLPLSTVAFLRADNFYKVVNALLTQLDKLKQRKNVLIMATSNLVKAIGLRISLRLQFFTMADYLSQIPLSSTVPI